jgi:hypothetical protein
VFKGLKITQDRNAADTMGLHRVEVRNRVGRLLLDEAGVIGAGGITGGGNSGFQALNLALQFGARQIILVGYDMTLANGSHWHGKHENGLGNPGHKRIEDWREVLDNLGPQLKASGVEVLNASKGSALQSFPFVELGSVC